MSSNVYTKDDILKELASNGYFVDSYTLDTFFKLWKVEAIFEDEQGREFYDQSIVPRLLKNFFNKDSQTQNQTPTAAPTMPTLAPTAAPLNIAVQPTQISVETPTLPVPVLNKPPESPLPAIVAQEDDSLDLFAMAQATEPQRVEPKPEIKPEYTVEQKVEPKNEEIVEAPKTPASPTQAPMLSDVADLLIDDTDILDTKPKETSPPPRREIPPPVDDDEMSDILARKKPPAPETDDLPKKSPPRPVLFNPLEELEDEVEKEPPAPTQAPIPDLLPEDPEANEVLKSIRLSDGTPLLVELDRIIKEKKIEIPSRMAQNAEMSAKFDENKTASLPQDMSGLNDLLFRDDPMSAAFMSGEGALSGGEDGDFDDLSLLSESIEAQEKFRDYIVSELNKKNPGVNPAAEINPESEEADKILSAIAKAAAKKIAKHVNSIYANNAKSSAQLEELKQQNAELEMKNRELEKQNKKLRLLLTESNKNLNSYKPSLFGLYKKTNPN